MSPSERRAVVDALPSDFDSASPPEGDPHRLPKQRALEALDAFFRRQGRRVYLSNELPVYYPCEPVFAPDLIAVVDAEPRERMRWVVTDEGKGIDLALEVTLHGSRRKDLHDNVERFARLGIPEYFVFDRAQRRLHGWRLDAGGRYQPVVPQLGRWPSAVLGLDLTVEGDRVRFYTGTALVPELHELVTRANQLIDDLQDRIAIAEGRAEVAEQRAEAAEQRAATEAERAATEAKRAATEAERAATEAERAERAERRAKELELELERLRRG